MIYEALVIDNSGFVEKGTIRVRIKQSCISPSMLRDLSENPTYSIDKCGGQRWYQTEKEKKFIYTDTDVKVSSGIGGGYDYGLFYLPQPNSWGLVAKIGDPWDSKTTDNYVWIGALYQRDLITKSINIPSDTMNNKNGVEDSIANISNVSSAIVLKTKTTSIAGGPENIDQDKSRESLDFKKRPIENLIVIDKDKIQIVHNVGDNEEKIVATETLNINADGFEINHKDEKSGNISRINLDNSGNFLIQKEADEADITLSGNEEGVNIDYIDSKQNGANVKIGKKDTSLGGNNKTEIDLTAFSGNGSCSIRIKDNGINVESSKDITIAPGADGKVNLGNNGMSVLVSPTGGDVLIGNVTIPCSKNVTA